MKKKLSVEAIASGTVIDHIPAGQGVKILRFFELTEGDERVTIGFNLPSGESAKKDLIKVENAKFSAEQANQLALFAPGATINVIENYEVVRKFKVELPERISSVLTCPNSNCISRSEPLAVSQFTLTNKGQDILLKCHYCEKTYAQRFFSEL